jgi:hypothetical protein
LRHDLNFDAATDASGSTLVIPLAALPFVGRGEDRRWSLTVEDEDGTTCYLRNSDAPRRPVRDRYVRVGALGSIVQALYFSHSGRLCYFMDDSGTYPAKTLTTGTLKVREFNWDDGDHAVFSLERDVPVDRLYLAMRNGELDIDVPFAETDGSIAADFSAAGGSALLTDKDWFLLADFWADEPDPQVETREILAHRETWIRATVVGEARNRHADIAATILGEAGIDYLRLPRKVRGRWVLAIDETSAEAAVRAIEAFLEQDRGGTWRLDIKRGTSEAPGAVTSLALWDSLRGSEDGPLVGASAAVTIQIWHRVSEPGVARPDGDGDYPVGTRIAEANHDAPYVLADTWRAAQESPAHWPRAAAAAPLLELSEPVDVVYTWVDDADPVWLERRRLVAEQASEAPEGPDARDHVRFRDRNELLYSLRSLEMNANWVRNVYIVTDRQVPWWLNTKNPRVHVVDHSEIFSDPSVLPVFNSHAIESQLHHIPGLARCYLYMNDDVFMAKPTTPGTFFLGNAVSKFFVSSALFGLEPADEHDVASSAAAKNGRDFIRREFGRTVSNKFKHTPHPQRRDVLEEMEQRYPDVFGVTASHRYRCPTDYSIAASLYHYYAFATHQAVPGDIRYQYVSSQFLSDGGQVERFIRERAYDVFCVNDDGQVHTEQDVVEGLLRRCFPLKSSFEI